jgi:4-amino-4-deoxy-L-arabinose transferase-like glycosyltransferase
MRAQTQQERQFDPRALFVGLILVAFGLRILGLTDHSIWWDEGISVWLARMPLLEAVRWTAGDVHPPLYYVVLGIWYRVAGEGVFVMRYPSVLASVLTVALIARLGRRLQGCQRGAAFPHVGLLAAGFLSVSRFSIRWAQEVRMYALAAMWATAALSSAVRLWRRPGRSAWLTHVVATVAGLFTLYLNATVLAVTNLGFLVLWLKDRDRRRARRWITAQAAVLAFLAPWLAYALPRMHSWSSDQAFGLAFFAKLYTTMLAVGTPLDLEAVLPLTLTALAGLTAGLIALAQRAHAPVAWASLTMLLAGVLLPPATVAIVSLPGLRFYFSRPLVPRYLLPLSACYYALLAWGLAALEGIQPARIGRALSVFFTAVALIGAVRGLESFYPGRTATDDYLTIAGTLEAHRRPEDAVLLYVDRDWPIFVAHYPGPRNDLAYGARWDAGKAAAMLAPIWEAHEAVWLVTTPEAQQADPQQHVRQWLEARAAAREVVVTGQNTLTFYARTEARAERRGTLVPDFDPPAGVSTPFGLRGAATPLSRYRTGDTVHLALYWTHAPDADVQVVLEGPSGGEVTPLDVPPVPSTPGVIRRLVSIPLTPELEGGTYRIVVRPRTGSPIGVGTFTLIEATAGTTASPDEIPNAVRYRLGESIRLIGYALPQADVHPGGSIPLTLYWRTDEVLDRRYKVFTHLVGDTFNARTETFLWGQQDNEPGQGQAPTSRWAPETVISDPYQIPIDPDAPPGIYTIQVGMYGLVDGVRLPVVGPEGQVADGAISLTTIEVREP